MNKHPISPMELLVLDHAGHVSNPLRRQALELQRQAQMHDLGAAQRIIETNGIQGQVSSIERDKQGKPISIMWKDHAGQNAPEEPAQ